jgi:hypothetical protein
MDDDARSRREHRRGAAAGAAQPPGEAAQAGAADEGGAHVDGVRMSGRAAPDVRPVRRRGRTRARLPVALDRRFEAVVFDWDGTAVPDRSADASRVRALVEGACARGIYVGIVSGTHVRNVDGQLLARPREPRLYLLLNRGSEVYVVGPRGPRLVSRRSATAAEEQALNAAASLAAERLAARGIETRVIADRLNRRKIDLIPLPEWSDPPKARIAELSDAVTRRLAGCSLPEAVAVCRAAARDAGLPDARVTTDVKHVEIGLTDKSDSREWMLEELWRHGIGPRSVLVLGDELGPLGGLPGSDARLLAPGVTAVSVGAEPEGVPDGVIHLGGGPARFARLLDDQLARRDRGAPPAVAPEPGWALELAADEAHERVHEALFTLADGRIGTRGSALRRGPASGTPSVLAAGVYGGEGPASELLPCPEWNRLGAVLAHQPGARRVLDLHAGIAAQEIRAPEGVVDVVCFSSLARPGVAVLDAGCVEPGPPLGDGDGDGDQVAVADGVPGGVVAAARQSRRSGRVRRIAAYATDGRRRPGPRRARDALARAHAAGFDRLLDEHRSAWARRWQDADIVLDGDDELQLEVRFALFHLMSSVRTRGEAARPPRAPCWSTGCAGCRPLWRRRAPPGGAAPGFRGSRRPPATTSHRTTPSTWRAAARRSSPARSRSMSSPTWRGPPRATRPGRATGGS